MLNPEGTPEPRLTDAGSHTDERHLARLTDLLDAAEADLEGAGFDVNAPFESEAARAAALAEARAADALEGLDGLAADDDLQAELRAAREARLLLRNSPVLRPPADFLRKTQRKLRRRTGGRYFHPVVAMGGHKFTIEVFAVIAVVVMAACWLFLQAESGRRAPAVLEELPSLAPASPEVPGD